MTHDELTHRAERWLRGTAKCSVVAREVVSTSFEVPDAIGWQSWKSILIECKASRADFLHDKKKRHRRLPYLGMGEYRYYMTPAGLVNVSEIPRKWGLLEVHGRMVRVVKRAQPHKNKDAAMAERCLLFRLLRERGG